MVTNREFWLVTETELPWLPNLFPTLTKFAIQRQKSSRSIPHGWKWIVRAHHAYISGLRPTSFLLILSRTEPGNTHRVEVGSQTGCALSCTLGRDGALWLARPSVSRPSPARMLYRIAQYAEVKHYFSIFLLLFNSSRFSSFPFLIFLLNTLQSFLINFLFLYFYD